MNDLDLWKAEIEAIKRKVTNPTIQSEPVIAFYGSSSIRLWGTLEEDLAPKKTVNLGFGGSSYFWCNYFFEEVFQQLSFSKVILYAGDNDLGTGTPEEEIISSFSQLVNKIKNQNNDAEIAVISVKPSPDRAYLRSNIEKLNANIEELIEEVGNDYIDVYSKMLNPDGSYRPELFTEDMLHMNAKGYEIWRKEIRDYLSGN